MTQERIECPFCSELIVRDALKCRFCREWLSGIGQTADQIRPIEAIDRPDTSREPRLSSFEDVRGDYLAMMESMGGQPRPVERIEHQGSSLPDESDHPTECTVESSDRVESGSQSYVDTIEDFRPHAEPIEKTQYEDSDLSGDDDRPDSDQTEDAGAVEVPPRCQWWDFDSAETTESDPITKETLVEETQCADDCLPDGDAAPADEQDKGGVVVEASPVSAAKEVVSEKKLRSDSVKKRSRVPWLRSLMFLLYMGIIGALGVSEFATQRALRDARANESVPDYDSAISMYSGILDVVPFSFGTIEARQNLSRLCQSQGVEMPGPSWRPAVKSLLGSGEDMPDVHLLPLVAWPLSAVLLFLVFVTRIFRPRIAILALMLMIVAVAGSIAQFAWCGSIALPPATKAAQGFMQNMPAVYFASYVLLLLTALMTLTATRKRKNLPTPKPEELWDVANVGG